MGGESPKNRGEKSDIKNNVKITEIDVEFRVITV